MSYSNATLGASDPAVQSDTFCEPSPNVLSAVPAMIQRTIWCKDITHMSSFRGVNLFVLSTLAEMDTLQSIVALKYLQIGPKQSGSIMQ